MSKDKVVSTIHIYKSFFSTPEGKLVLFDLMGKYYMPRSYVPNDPHGTSFNEGCRSVVIDILNKVNIDVNAMEKLLKERENANEYDTII